MLALNTLQQFLVWGVIWGLRNPSNFLGYFWLYTEESWFGPGTRGILCWVLNQVGRLKGKCLHMLHLLNWLANIRAAFFFSTGLPRVLEYSRPRGHWWKSLKSHCGKGAITNKMWSRGATGQKEGRRQNGGEKLRNWSWVTSFSSAPTWSHIPSLPLSQLSTDAPWGCYHSPQMCQNQVFCPPEPCINWPCPTEDHIFKWHCFLWLCHELTTTCKTFEWIDSYQKRIFKCH